MIISRLNIYLLDIMEKILEMVGFLIGLKLIYQWEENFIGKIFWIFKFYFILFNRFACNRWLDKKEGDGKIELELRPSDVIRKEGGKYFNLIFINYIIKIFFLVIPYEITVFTGDKPGAGTNAKVFIQMYGLNGQTEETVLKSKSDAFERKKVRIKFYYYYYS